MICVESLVHALRCPNIHEVHPLGVTTVLTMTFLGLEARTDLPQVAYPTALDYFVFISFVFKGSKERGCPMYHHLSFSKQTSIFEMWITVVSGTVS